MRKPGALWALTASLLIVSLSAWLPAAAQESSTKPPTNLKKVGDHWTPWDPPAAGPDAYIIVKGDTLWDLAEKWLGDPFLWPQIWDENRYILDSHWIYPGDPLVIPGRPTVVPEGELPAEEMPPAEPEETGDTGGTAVETVEPVPMQLVADPADVYCTGYITPDHQDSELWVGGTDLEKEYLGQGDIVYLSHGKDLGLQPGDEFAVLREVRDVVHPTTGQAMGSFIRRLGRVRVMLVHDDTATGVIELACEDIHMSDELVPWQTIPIPMRESLPPFDRYDPTPSGGPTGTVVMLGDDRLSVATGHVVHTDLGLASGVQPGDVLNVYREQVDLPRINLGQAIVLTVDSTSSMAKIAYSVRETEVGDSIEVDR